MTALLAIDVGTTTLRVAVVDESAAVRVMRARPSLPSTPMPGLVEFDAAELAAAVVELATELVDDARSNGEPIGAVGITNQRCSTVVWDRGTGEPIAPAIGWQDLRTVIECITAKAEHGLALAPNQSATKLPWLLDHVEGARERDLCFGTVDSWLAWTLTAGAAHVTDHTNAAVTGLLHADGSAWNEAVCDALRIPLGVLPALVSSSAPVGDATVLPGSPPLTALVGDQQGSLVGQGCVAPGRAKITFGTGGMLDLCTGPQAPASAQRGAHGTYPIVAWSRGKELQWGIEAIMLAAGSNVEWLRDDLGLIVSSAESHDVARRCDSTDGVVFVPALLGLGTPAWDYGARGTLLGVTRGTGRAHIVRAVLEGIAQRGADLVAAAEDDTGLDIDTLRLDGGMSANPTFTQAVADATGKVVEISPVAEATTIGAAFLAGLAVGVWDDIADADRTWVPAAQFEPGAPLDRARWADAVGRARRWIPELSALDF